VRAFEHSRRGFYDRNWHLRKLRASLAVLHWHLVDRESFPLVLDSAPRLSLAAWSTEERYSSADVKRIVEFARLRGIRVVSCPCPYSVTPAAQLDCRCLGWLGTPVARAGMACRSELPHLGGLTSLAGARD
jgi:hypothetical protein